MNTIKRLIKDQAESTRQKDEAIVNLRFTLKQYMSDASRAADQLAKSDARVEHMQAELASMEAANKNLCSLIQDERQRIDDLLADHSIELGEKEAIIASLQSDISTTATAVTVPRDRHLMRVGAGAVVKNELAHVFEKQLTLKDQIIATLHAKLAARLSSSSSSSSDANTDATTTKKCDEERFIALVKDNALFRGELNKLSVEYERLERRCTMQSDEAEAQIRALNAKLCERESQVSSLLATLDDKDALILKLRTTQRSASAESTATTTKASTNMDACESVRQRKLEGLLRLIQEKNQHIDKLTSEIDRLRQHSTSNHLNNNNYNNNNSNSAESEKSCTSSSSGRGTASSNRELTQPPPPPAQQLHRRDNLRRTSSIPRPIGASSRSPHRQTTTTTTLSSPQPRRANAPPLCGLTRSNSTPPPTTSTPLDVDTPPPPQQKQQQQAISCSTATTDHAIKQHRQLVDELKRENLSLKRQLVEARCVTAPASPTHQHTQQVNKVHRATELHKETASLREQLAAARSLNDYLAKQLEVHRATHANAEQLSLDMAKCLSMSKEELARYKERLVAHSDAEGRTRQLVNANMMASLEQELAACNAKRTKLQARTTSLLLLLCPKYVLLETSPLIHNPISQSQYSIHSSNHFEIHIYIETSTFQKCHV